MTNHLADEEANSTLKQLTEPLTDPSSSDPVLLRNILETAKWIQKQEIKTKYGKTWKQTPTADISLDESPLLFPKSLYGGSAGIGFFFLKLYLAVKDPKYLKEAEAAADHILSTYEGKKLYERVDEGTCAGIGTGFYNGPAGEAYFLWYLYEETGRKEYRSFVLQAANDLIAGANRMNDSLGGIAWGDASGIISDGGLVLFLLWIYEKTKEKRYLDAAVQAGERIRKEARPAPEGIRWYAQDSIAFGYGPNGYFPNFFYGTSGNAYVQACLYEKTGRTEFLTAAKKGAEYVESVAVRKNGAIFVPYNDPYDLDLYYLGMCQGPIGTSRLFFKLYELTGEESYKEWTLGLTDALEAAGAPEKHSPGYWHTYCYCCGAAGMLEHYLGIYHAFGDEKHLRLAERCADVLIRDSFADLKEQEEKEPRIRLRRWYTAWTRTIPENRRRASDGASSEGASAGRAGVSLPVRSGWRKHTSLFGNRILGGHRPEQDA
ncbi:MAG: hypothetical protein PUC44_07720 [Eubacteriales bacterium]|nr:hypothetical protein [Eubacteriales bacterium]